MGTTRLSKLEKVSPRQEVGQAAQSGQGLDTPQTARLLDRGNVHVQTHEKRGLSQSLFLYIIKTAMSIDNEAMKKSGYRICSEMCSARSRQTS